MYSTCLFCHTDLGANEEIEHFPIGRRLAFDAAKGRLWVVCRKCERWNLTPLEERWEAIEECERSFRATKLRVSTDEIGMARLLEGLELVRIGKPLRPEFAAWRYGDQFGRRRRNNMIKVGVGVAVIGTYPFLGATFAASLGGAGAMVPNMWSFGYAMYLRRVIVARVAGSDGNVAYVRGTDVHRTVILAPTRHREWGLRFKHRAYDRSEVPWWRYSPDSDESEVYGEEAVHLAAGLLPRLNRRGASKGQLEKAISVMTEYPNPSAVFDRAARQAASKRSWKDRNFLLPSSPEPGEGGLMMRVPAEIRLALEMASHEESERRAMEGELELLEAAWREAEEIASISDDMFLPTSVSESLAEIKNRVSPQKN
ncbi:MAG: hypothetical protein ACREMS_04995 [Gemmatimonadaceae bacterium]